LWRNVDRGLAGAFLDCRSRSDRIFHFSASQKARQRFIEMSTDNPLLVESIPGLTSRSDSPLRVTHVVLALDVGGLERIVVDLMRAGRAHGLDPSVICLERPGTLAVQVEDLGIPILCADKPSGVRLGTVGRVRELLRQVKPDVVHTHQIGALFYAGPAARLEKVPVVVHTEHTNNVAMSATLNKKIRTRLLWGLAGSFADRFCCVSDEIAEAVRAYGTVAHQKVSVVPNGVDTAAFASTEDRDSLRRSLGIPRDVPVIGTVGRLNEVKSQDLLIRGFANIATVNSMPHLLLVGDGPEFQRLRQLAADLGISDRVHFTGYQARPDRFLHLMDIFALTSRREGMPLAILEAWAAGRPIIASRVGGVPGIVTEGHTGMLFDSGDEAALTHAMTHILANPLEARRLGEAGRDYVRSRYDLRVMADSYEQHYRGLHHGFQGSSGRR
jgi:glycosyltransferase involved in cell wall biosynthesis